MTSQTVFVFRAVQRGQTFDQFVTMAIIQGNDVPVTQVNDAPDLGTDASADDGAQPEEAAVATQDNENSDSDANTSATTGADDQTIATAAVPAAAAPVRIHHRILPQDPDGTLSQLQHILNSWQVNTNSPWVSVSDSLVFGVYYKPVANYVTTQTGSPAQVQGYQPRDLYALEVPRNALERFNPPPPLTNRERMALNFTIRFQEWLAHRQLEVYRYEQVVIPDDVLEWSQLWFHDRYNWAQAQEQPVPLSCPFDDWETHMSLHIGPEWVTMIPNPVAVWQSAAMVAFILVPLVALTGVDINAE